MHGETLGAFSPSVAPRTDGSVVSVERLLVGECTKAIVEGAPFPRYAAAASVRFLARDVRKYVRSSCIIKYY